MATLDEARNRFMDAKVIKTIEAASVAAYQEAKRIDNEREAASLADVIVTRMMDLAPKVRKMIAITGALENVMQTITNGRNDDLDIEEMSDILDVLDELDGLAGDVLNAADDAMDEESLAAVEANLDRNVDTDEGTDEDTEGYCQCGCGAFDQMFGGIDEDTVQAGTQRLINNLVAKSVLRPGENLAA